MPSSQDSKSNTQYKLLVEETTTFQPETTGAENIQKIFQNLSDVVSVLVGHVV